jgi:toluene monooxygenase system protein A
VPREAWSAWEEDYKVTYPEYVATQRDKEASAYAVKAALQRSTTFDHLDEGWKSATKMHFGGVALVEYAAVLGELKMARFGLTAAWRNMATFGQLDEMRHAQITTFFGHEFIGKDAQYDWTQKTFHTNDWVPIALRNLFDNMMIAPNVVDMAIELPLTFETGFTNLQFVALASDALGAGDVNFANMISSIQTDEARHSQQGGPTLEILVEHDPVRAQWVIDKSFCAGLRRPHRPGDGLLHPAGAPQAVLPRVHGGVDHRPVHPHHRGLRTEEALVLGRVHAGTGHLAPRSAHGPVVLAPHPVVAAQGRRQQG